MASATDKLLDQVSGHADTYGDLKPAILGVDLENFLIDVIHHRGLNINVAGSITDGSIDRAIDTASSVTVTFHDPRRVLLNSDIWDYIIDVTINGFDFRLVQVGKSGDDLTMVFEDRLVALSRHDTKPLAISRNKMTRAEFIRHMVMELNRGNPGVNVDFFSPELHKKQPIKKPKTPKERRKHKAPGLHKDITVKDPQTDRELSKEQKSNIERVLDVGDHKHAPQEVQIAAIMCIYQESRCLTSATNGVHVGLFQQDPRYWPATRNPEKDATAWYDRVIANYKKGPHVYTTAGLIESVQASGQPSLYGQWESWARGVVYKYDNSDPSSSSSSGSYTRKYAKQYQFTRGQPDGPKGENTWQASGRLAAEVKWRFFLVGNTFFYMSDPEIMKQKPIMVIDEDSPGIITIDYDVDFGKHAHEGTITCRAERWFAHPGEVIALKDSMGRAKGRWIVERISRPFFSETTTITITRPHKPSLEPAHEINQVTKERKSKQQKGNGKVTIAPGANRPGMPLHQQVIDFLQEVAANTSEKIEIGTGTNHSQYSTSGLQSDHWLGWGADVLVGGDARSSTDAGTKGDNIATAVLVTCGLNRKLARQRAHSGQLDFGLYSVYNWRGYRIQVGWRTLNGGNHYNHVHVGLKKL